MAPKPAAAGHEQLRGAMTHQTKTVHIVDVALSVSWSRGVPVSTLDPESSNRGSNPHETFLQPHGAGQLDMGSC